MLVTKNLFRKSQAALLASTLILLPKPGLTEYPAQAVNNLDSLAGKAGCMGRAVADAEGLRKPLRQSAQCRTVFNEFGQVFTDDRGGKSVTVLVAPDRIVAYVSDGTRTEVDGFSAETKGPTRILATDRQAGLSLISIGYYIWRYL